MKLLHEVVYTSSNTLNHSLCRNVFVYLSSGLPFFHSYTLKKNFEKLYIPSSAYVESNIQIINLVIAKNVISTTL